MIWNQPASSVGVVTQWSGGTQYTVSRPDYCNGFQLPKWPVYSPVHGNEVFSDRCLFENKQCSVRPPLNFTGSGFLEDNQGGALGPTITLQAFPVTDLGNQTGVDLLLRPLASNAVPGDAYGFHLDLTLPDSPGFGFGSGPAGGVTIRWKYFRDRATRHSA